MSAIFCIDDREYVVEHADWTPPTRATRDDPGDGGEVWPARVVEVTLESGFDDVVTYDTFVRELAADRGWSTLRAESHVEDRLIEYLCESSADEPDDDYDMRADL